MATRISENWNPLLRCPIRSSSRFLICNSSASPPNISPPPFSPSVRGTGGGNVPRWRGRRGWNLSPPPEGDRGRKRFPPPLVGGVRGGGGGRTCPRGGGPEGVHPSPPAGGGRGGKPFPPAPGGGG